MQNISLRLLGNTSIEVSRLSFGTVFMGHRGDQLLPLEGADLLIYAFRQGINFWDTSEDYGTHTHIACALQNIPRHKVVISSKLNLPATPVESLLQELGTSYIDILLVHDVSLEEVPAARDVLQSWQKDISKGKIRAIGLSTHSALVAESVYEWAEVQVLMLPINMAGSCLPGRPIEGGIERLKAIANKARAAGKGIVAMKVLGFGTLAHQAREAIEYVTRLPYVDSLCIGMRNRIEIEQNVEIISSTRVKRSPIA